MCGSFRVLSILTVLISSTLTKSNESEDTDYEIDSDNDNDNDDSSDNDDDNDDDDNNDNDNDDDENNNEELDDGDNYNDDVKNIDGDNNEADDDDRDNDNSDDSDNDDADNDEDESSGLDDFDAEDIGAEVEISSVNSGYRSACDSEPEEVAIRNILNNFNSSDDLDDDDISNEPIGNAALNNLANVAEDELARLNQQNQHHHQQQQPQRQQQELLQQQQEPFQQQQEEAQQQGQQPQQRQSVWRPWQVDAEPQPEQRGEGVVDAAGDYNTADSEFYQQSLFKCEEEGFHPDPRDCRIYYQCVDWGNSSPFTSFKFECGSGTVFSKTKGNICVHPSDNERSKCDDLQNEIQSDLKQFSMTRLSTMSSHFTEEGNDAIGNYKCTQEGFMGDARDCSKFYRCVKERYDQYVRYEFTCGAGTVWDQHIQGCNYPWSVLRKECRSSLSVTGISTTKVPWNVDNSIRQPSSVGTPGATNDLSNLGTSVTPVSSVLAPWPEIPGFNEIAGSPVRPGTSGISTIYARQPTSKATLGISTAPGFSAKTESWPLQQGFSKPSGFSESTEIPGTSDKLENSVRPGGSEADTDPVSCSQEGVFPDPQDCQKFYVCVDEGFGYTKYVFQCGIGTGWDSKLQTCNYLHVLTTCNSGIDTLEKNGESETYLNKDNLTTRQPKYQSSTIFATVPESSSLSNKISPTYLPSNNVWPSTPSSVSTERSSTSSLPFIISSTYLNHNDAERSTLSYEIASNSFSSTRSSSSTSPQSLSQSSENTISGETLTIIGLTSLMPSLYTSSLPITETTKPGNAGCQGGGFFPNTDDCRKFFRCVKDTSGYRRFHFDCGPGTAWDQSLQTCNYISQVSTCQSANNEIEQGSSASSKPPISGVPPTMTSYTPNETVDKPNTVTQLLDSITSASTTDDRPTLGEINSSTESSSLASSKSESFISSSTLSSSESSESSETSESNETSSKTPSDNPNCSSPKTNNRIVCNTLGFYAHPTRCNQFYRCVDNENGFSVYHFDCPPGTIFDPSISVCNYPESVYPARDCSLGQKPSTTSSITSSKPTTTTNEVQESATTVTSTGNTTSNQESGSQESTTESETTESSVETTDSETTTSDASSESSTSESDSKTTSQTEDGSATTESTEIVSTEISSVMTEQSSATTELTSETSTSEESMFTTKAIQETSLTDSTEQSNTGQESTTELQEITSNSTMSPEPGFANCPITANLTDQQVLLVCPTGFRRHPKFCNLLYQCTSEGNMEIKILTLSCPENTIFDEMKIQCVPEAESSQTCTGSTNLARFYRRLNNNNLSPVKLSSQSICPSEGHYPFRDGCSSAFYKCKNSSRGFLQGYLYKCPKDFVYWEVSRRCERATRLPMCTSLRNKTERDSWESRWEVPIEDNNLSARMLYLE